MSLIFNPTSGVAYLETEEAVPWASLGGRTYTHFVLVGDTVSKAYSQYVWSTGNYLSANALNMYYAAGGQLVASAGPSTAEISASATSPAFGGGLLRLAVIRGLGVQNSNADVDYQVINLGFLPGSSSVQILSSSIQKYTTTSGSNSFAARKLTLGDRQTTPEQRKFFGTMHFAGSVNRALNDNELIAILQGDIPVLDYFKHDLVELWDFQRGDESALTGLISGTTFKMFGGSNLTWDQSAPLPVSRTRGHTILGATNRSVLVPVWAYGESSGDNLINVYPAGLSLNSRDLSPLQGHSIEPSNLSLSSNPLSTLASVDVLHGSAELTNNNIELSQQLLLNPGSVGLTSNDITLARQVILTPGTYTVTSNDLTTQLYIDITKGSVVTQGNSIIIDTGYPSNSIGITQGNIALLGSNILTNTNINVSPSSVTSSGNQVNIARYVEILAGNASVVGSNIYIDTDFPYLNIDISPSNLSTLGNQITLDRVANLVINKGDILTLGSNILIHTQADNLINIAYGNLELLGSGVVVIRGEPYDSGRRLGVTRRDYILQVRGKYVLRVFDR